MTTTTMRNRVEPSACVAKGSRFRIKPVVAALCSALAVSAIAHAPAWSAPTGGAVAQGEGAIGTPDAQTVQVTQTSDKLIVNWQGFSLAADELARFVQPSRDAVALNRVTGADPSVILGRLSANGQVFLVNPNGVVFGRSAVVDVASLVASTLNITDDDFMNGRYLFLASEGDAGVLNQGTIRAADGGYIVLIGNQAQNEGVLAARLGTVALGAGKQATLDLAGDGLLRFAVDGEVLGAKVANRGLIQADGGRVLLSARAARDLLATVVSNEGVIEARSLVNRGGVIRLEASDPLDAAAMGTGVASVQNAAGDVINTGRLDVSAAERGAARGLAVMTGARVGHAGEIRADGADGTAAGKVYLNASQKTLLASGSAIRADGRGAQSNGGEIRVLSDLKTGTTVVREAAQLSARGGEVSGDGGFIEVSGANFALHGDISVGATDGRAGTFLLDPTDILIVNPKADMPEKGADYNDSGDANAKKLPDGGGNSLLFGTANFDAGGGDELTEDNDSTATDNNDTVSNEIEAAYLVTLDGNVRLQATQDILIGVNDGAPDSALMADAMLLDFANLGAGDSLTLQAGRHITMNAAGSEIKTAGGAIHLEADSPHTGATGAADGTGTLTAGKLTSGGGGITLIGADFALGGAVNAGAGKVAVAPGVDGAAFKLGSPSGAVLTDAEIDLITADTITLGQANSAGADGLLGNSDDKLLTAGDTTIDDVTPAGTTKLRLISSTIVNDADDTGNAVAVANLHLEADAAGTTSTFNIDADTLTGAGSADAGNFNITDSDGLSVADLVNANGAITINTGGATTLTKVETKGGTDTDDITVKASAGDLTVKAVTAASSGDVTLEATAGAILDDEAGANATTVITGDVVTLTAKSGVGTPTTNIDTKAATLDVSVTDAGLIKLSEADGVNLLAIDTANGLIDITTGGDTTATNLASTTDAAANTVTLTATAGDIDIGTINAKTLGNVTITANSAAGQDLADADDNSAISGATVTLTAKGDIGTGTTKRIETAATTLDVSSTDVGDIYLAEADGVELKAIDTANGLVDITTGGDTVATNLTSTTDAAANTITLTATAGDIEIGTIDAKTLGNVTLTADSAAGQDILDADDNSTISGATVTLTAKGNIGTGATKRIETAATTLDVSSTDVGDIYLAEADGVELKAVDTANGHIDSTAGGNTVATQVVAGGAGKNVTLATTVGDISVDTVTALDDGITLNAAGAITDNNGATNNLSAASANLTAGSAIGTAADALDTTVATLGATANAGGVYIAEADAVTLNAIEAKGAGNDVVVTNAAGDMTVVAVTAADDITLEATAGAILDDEAGTASATAIAGDVVTLTAKSGVGTATTNIDTKAATLDVSVTDAGLIKLAEADGVNLLAIDTANGLIDITTGGDTVATNLTSATDAAANTITLVATAGDVEVGTIDAKTLGNVTLTADSAAGQDILDADDNSAISGATVTLTAKGNIGTGTTKRIETAATTLDVSSTDAGHVYLAEKDGVELKAIDTANGLIDVTTGGETVIRRVAAVGDARLAVQAGDARLDALSGNKVSLTAEESILDINDANGVTRNITAKADTLLKATQGTVGTNTDGIEVDSAGKLSLYAGGEVGLVSGNINGEVLGNVIHPLNTAPGLLLLNGKVVGGGLMDTVNAGRVGTQTQLAYLDDLPVPRPIAFNTARHYPTDSVTEEMAFVPAAPLALPSLWKTLGNGTHLPDGVLNWAPQTTER